MGLIEIMLAVGILGAIGVAFMGGLASVYRAQNLNREQVLAQNLVRAALEDIRNQDYLPSYTVFVPVPDGYSLTVETVDPYCPPPPVPCELDGNLQKNTVSLSRGGKPLLFIEDLKTKR